MLNLPDVTLVMIETMDHEMARLAVRDCLDKANFGEVLICTDQPERFHSLNCSPRFHLVENWPEKIGWSRFSWLGLPPLLRTPQTLNIQWDSWIWDASMWRDEFLDYDYIGAPWWYRDGKNVGNGGFALRSTGLLKYIYNHKDRFPCTTAVDDDLYCRKYRPMLEEAGFVWAPERVARDFAFECVRPAPDSRHFGFHGLFNFPHVLGRDELLNRLRIAKASPYIGKSYMWDALAKSHPDVSAELDKDEFSSFQVAAE